MAVKFRVVQKGEPGVAGGGAKKHYAQVVNTGVQDIDALTRAIEKISTVSGADIRAVLYALTDVMTESLANSNIVRLGELGSIRVSLSSAGFADEKEVDYKAVRRARILFTPGTGLKNMLKTLKYTKVASI